MLLYSWFSSTMIRTCGVDVVTVKLAVEVTLPPGAVTVMAPVVAPLGTVVLILMSEFTVKVAVWLLKKWTAVAPVKPLPLITTGVPTGPLVGVKLLIVGGGGGPVATLNAAMAPVHV